MSYSLKAAPHDLCKVGGSEERHASHRAHDAVDCNLQGEEERQHDLCHEEDGDKGHAPDELDE